MKILLALAILLALLSTVGEECYRRKAMDFEARATTAETSATANRHLADAAAESASAAGFRASQSRQEAQGLRVALAHAKAAVDSTVDTVLVTAPAECSSVVALVGKYRDLYDQQEAVVVALTEAGRQDSLALVKRTEEAGHLRAALDILGAALASRPHPRKWWLPEPIIYGGWGVTATGGQVRTGWQVGVGLRIHW